MRTVNLYTTFPNRKMSCEVLDRKTAADTIRIARRFGRRTGTTINRVGPGYVMIRGSKSMTTLIWR
jgi:hypothetical protein